MSTTYSFFIKIEPLYANSDTTVYDDLKLLFEKEILPKSIRFPKELDVKLAKDLNYLRFDNFYEGNSSRITLVFKEELTTDEQDKLVRFLTDIITDKDNQILFDNLSYLVKTDGFLYDWK